MMESQSWEYVLSGDVITYLWNFAIVLILCSVLWRKVFLPREDQILQNDETEGRACTSPNCVRCSNYVFLREKLLEKFESFKSSYKWTENTDKCGQRRLERAMEKYRPGRIPGVQLVPQRPTVFHFPGLEERPWFDDPYGEELAILRDEKNLSKFKKEFQNVYLNFRYAWTINKVPQGKWETFYLMNQGIDIEENMIHCPETSNIISQIKSFMTGCAFGNALFSIIHPHTHIEEHYGPTNIRLRCHVPLIIPEGCSLVVAGEERQWREGEIVLFDDSFLHEAWHKGSSEDKEPRVVFMLDLWHPALSLFERECLGNLFSLK